MASNQEHADRRHCVRQRLHAPAFASFDGVTGGMILDLSEEGMSMQGAVTQEAHKKVKVQIDLSEPATHVETTGYIAWADALGRAGVRFSELPTEARQRLNEWLTLNADAPSQMAPKLNLRETARTVAWPGTNVKAMEGGSGRVSLSLEPEESGDVPNKGLFTPGPQSRTVQYEFNSLGPDLNAALRLIGERARSLTRGTSAAIGLRHKVTVICRASVGAGAPSLGTHLDVNSGFAGECFRTGKSMRCDDTEIDPRVDLETCRRLGIRSIVGAPIRSERETIGLITVFGEKPFNFDEGDVAIVESLAHRALLAVNKSIAPRVGAR